MNFARVEKNGMRKADRYFQTIMDKLITQTNRADLAKLDRVKSDNVILFCFCYYLVWFLRVGESELGFVGAVWWPKVAFVV